MAANNRIDFQVRYNVDQASINSLKKSLQDIQKIKIGDFNGSASELAKIQQTAQKVGIALQNAFNVNLGSLNAIEFTRQLQSIQGGLQGVHSQFAKLGAQGQIAFNNMASSVLTTNLQLKQTHSLINSMGQTMANTVKWGIASSIMNQFTGAVKNAFSYVQSLDSALTDIRIVTGDSTQQMKQFAVEANNAAQSLGRSTMDYTKAALTFYQQGLDESAVQARTEAVLKAQNITGAGDQMADYLTAVWNGYRVANEEAQLYVDKLAAVADSSASNMSQLAVAMSKVASTARAMGVDVDSLNAQIATIVATTRQAPESVGNALKTIYARINDIATGADDAEVSLGNYSKQMAAVGFSVLDANGNLRDTGDVIEQIGGKWESLSREQQIYLARTMAGQRQYNNLIALFDNWSNYTDLVNVSLDSQGTLMQKNSRYMESLGAKMQQLGAAGERFKSALINEQDLKGLTQFGTNAVNVFASLIQSIGGGRGALLNFGSIFASLFSGTISKEINNIITNIQNAKNNAEILKADIENTQTFKIAAPDSKAIDVITIKLSQIQKYYSVMDQASINTQKNLIDELGQIQNTKTAIQGKQKVLQQYAARVGATDTKRIWEQETNQIHLVQDAIESLSGSSVDLRQLYNNFRDTGQVTDQFKNTFNEFLNSYEQLNPDKAERLKQIWSDIQRDGTTNGSFTTVINNAIDQAIQKTNQFTNTLSNSKQEYVNLNNQATKLSNTIDSNTQKAKQLFDVTNIVNFISAFGRLASGINNVINLTKIWKNENISTGQKILQTVTNLSMTLPMLITSISSISKILGISQILIDKRLLKEKQINLQLQIRQKLLQKNNLTEAARQHYAVGNIQTGNLYSQLANEKQKQALTLIDDFEKTKKQLENLPNVAKQAGQKIGDTFKSLGKGLVEWFTDPITAIPTLLAAGAIAVGAIIYNNWNKEAQAAQKAAQSAKKLKQQYNGIKQSYNNLKQSFENYNSAQQAIKEMTKNTQQWRDAIRQSNDAVLELINNYPALADKVQNVNGQLILSQQAQQQFLELQNQRLTAAQNASIAAGVNARDANINLQASEIMKNTSVGLMYTGLGSGFTGEGTRDAANELAIKVAEALNNGITKAQIFEQLGSKSYLAEEIFKNSEQLDALRTQLKQNQAATKLQYESIVDQTLASDKTYQGFSQLEQQIARTQGADVIQNRIEEIENQINEKLITRFTTANDQVLKDLLVRFNAATGNNATFASNAVTGGNIFTGEGASINLRIDGQDVSYTKEQIATTIAATEALKDLGNSAKETAEMLKDIDKIGDNQNSDAIKNFVAGNGFGSLTEDQLNNLMPKSQQMANFFNQYYEQVGYSSGYAFQQAFIQAQQSDLKRFRDLGKTFGNTVQQAIEDSVKSQGGLSLNAKESLANALNDAFKNGGKSGIESLKTIIESLQNDPQQLEAFSNLVGNIDWSDENAAYQLTQAIQEQGIAVDTSSQAWQQYIKYLEETALKSASAEQAINKVRSALQLLNQYSDIERWSIISDQDYDKLIQANPKIKQLFQVAADGYMFIGQQEDLMDMLTGGQSKVENTIQHFKELQQAARGVAYNAQHGVSASDVDINNLTNRDLDFLHSSTNLNALQLIAGVSEEDLNDALNTFKYYQNEIDAARRAHQAIDSTVQQQYEKAKETVQTYLNGLSQMQMDYQNGLLDNSVLSQLLATSATTMAELNANFRTGQMAMQDFLTAYKRLDQEQDLEGLDSEQIKDFGRHLRQVAEDVEDLDDKLLQNQQASQIVAKSIIKMNDAVQTLSSNFENWRDILEHSSQGSQEYYNAIEGTRGALADLLDTSQRYISNDFITSHLDQITAAAEGSGEAIDQLHDYLADEIIARIVVENSLQNQDQLYSLVNQIQAKIPEIQVGTELNLDGMDESSQQFVDMCNQLIRSAGLSVDQANALFDSLGFETTFETIKQPVTKQGRGVIHAMRQVGGYTVPQVNPFTGQGRDIVVPAYEQYTYPGTPYTYTDWVDTYAMGVNDNAPKIKTITRKASGAYNNSSSQNAGGAKSSGSKGKSGGSGSAKKPTVAKLDTTKIEPTRKERVYNPYQQVQKSYQRQGDLIDDLQDKEKKLVNRDRLQNLEQQNAELEKQNAIIEQRQRISDSGVKGTTAYYRNQLAKQLGATFDSDGQIADQVAITNKAVADFNKAARQAQANEKKAIDNYNKWITNVYNKASAERQQALKAEKQRRDNELKDAKDAAKQQIDKAKEVYDNRIKTISDYKKALQEDLKYQQQYAQNLEKIYQNRIEGLKLVVDLKVDAGDFEREWLDFENKFIKKLSDDDIVGNAKASVKQIFSYLNSGQIQAAQDYLNTLQQEIAKMQNGQTSNIYGTNLAQAKEDLEQYTKQQMEALMNIQQLVDDTKDRYLDAIDEANDKMKDQVDQYERINSLIDHDVKLLELLYGDKAYDTREKYYDLQKKNNQQELESLRQQQQFWQNRMDQQIVGSDAWKKFKDNLDSVTDDLNSKLEQMIQNLSDQWQNRVDGIIEKLNNSLTGGFGTDYLDEQWDYINDYDDKFLDTFNSTVGVQEIENLYNQAIEGLAGNPKAQQRINNLMKDQLKILKEKDALTEYDLERAKAMLQVEQARMDLEDARNNKTKMRLRRDSQGNYTYQYVADEEQLGDLQQALADAQANLYNTDKDHYKQNLNDLYDTYKDYLSKMKDLTAEYNATQDEQERARIQNRIDLLKESQQKMMQGLLEDNDYLLKQYLTQSYFDGMGINTANMSLEEMIQALRENVPQAASAIQDLGDSIRDQGGLLSATADAVDQINQATEDHDKAIKEQLETAGTSLQTISNVTDDMGQALDSNITAAQNLLTTNQMLIESCKKQIEAMQDLLSMLDQYLNKAMNVEQIVANLRSAYNIGQILNGSSLTADEIPVSYDDIDTTFADEGIAKAYYDYLKSNFYETFDLESPEEDLDNAIKEFVDSLKLNDQVKGVDIESVIRAADVVQGLTSALGNYFNTEVESFGAGLNGILGNLNTNETLDQNVHIDASFPNASNAAEIEAAFNNLINMASMYASKNKD